MSETLAEALARVEHLTWCDKPNHSWGDYDMADSLPRAEAVLAWFAARLADDELREAVARTLAGMDSDDEWPTNAELGGGLTGTRDDEYRDAHLDLTNAALAAVRTHLGLS